MSTASTAMSTGIFSGIFTTEPGQRLLQILLKLAEQAFRALYDKCALNLSGQYYQTGLRRVRNWSDDVINEDIGFVKMECSDIDTTFHMCFKKYVEHWFQTNKVVLLKRSFLFDFVCRFLEALGEHDALKTGDYFVSKEVMFSRVACMDACRTALSKMMTPENVQHQDDGASVVHTSSASLERRGVVTVDDDAAVGPD